MVEHHIDFAKYDEDDLYAALQTVDEETYPHHALDLYRVLKSRAIDQEAIAEKARTVSFGPLDEVFELLMAPLLTNHKLDGDGLGSKLARLQVLEEKMTN